MLFAALRYAATFPVTTVRARCYTTSRITASNFALTSLKQLLKLKPNLKTLIPSGLIALHLIRPNAIAFCERRVSRDANRFEHVLRTSKSIQQPPPILSTPWADIWRLLRPHLLLLVLAVAGALVVAYINIQIPLLLGKLINDVDRLSDTSSLTSLHPSVIKLLTSYGFQSLFTSFYISVLSVMGERMATDLRIQYVSSMLKQDIAFYDINRSGDLTGRLAADVQEFKSSFKQIVSQGLRSATQIAGSLISCYFISPKMTVVVGLGVPTMVLCGSFVGHFLRHLSRMAQDQISQSIAIADESFSNIRTVRAFAMEDKELELYSNEAYKAQFLNQTLGVGIGLFQGATNFFLNVVVLGVLYGGSTLIASNQLTPGDLMAFMVTTQTTQRSLGQFSLLFGQSVRGFSAAARIFYLINIKPILPISGGDKIPYHSFLGDIRFENVGFSYPARSKQSVLDDFSLHIPSGKVVALCGSSGAGKSTVAALLDRLYDVRSGRILIDGNDIRKLDPRWLRGTAIGVIAQEPVLFGGSIAENIRYGKPTASQDEVVAAAKLANAHEFISAFSNGYSTRVGERGLALSGGQKQRIAIARAMIKNPQILILDEATSALDAESEFQVREALSRASKGRTVLIIAHRLSTVKHADCIVVMKDGTIVESGSHDKLLRLNKHYADLVKRQESS